MNTKRGKNKNKKRNAYKVRVTPTNQVNMPNSMVVTHAWNDDTTVRTNSGQLYAIFAFRLNGLFDPDPALGGGSAFNYDKLAALYFRYRVLKVRIEGVFCNNEDFPVVLTGAPSWNALSPSGPTDVLNLGELPYALPVCIMSAKGGKDRCHVKFELDLAEFLGKRSTYLTDTTYQSANNALPTRSCFFYWGLTSPNGSNFTTAGVANNIRLAFDTEWTDRIDSML